PGSQNQFQAATLPIFGVKHTRSRPLIANGVESPPGRAPGQRGNHASHFREAKKETEKGKCKKVSSSFSTQPRVLVSSRRMVEGRTCLFMPTTRGAPSCRKARRSSSRSSRERRGPRPAP